MSDVIALVAVVGLAIVVILALIGSGPWGGS